jgi:hypothetical protein
MRQATIIAMVFAVLAAAAAMTAASVQARSASSWYWTPGLCKSKLTNYGVQIGDGRSFNVAQAFCIGKHDHCTIHNNARMYKVFWAVMRSYDGVVRRMVLQVTGKTTWSGGKLQIIDQYMSPQQFANDYGNAAWVVAHLETNNGCWDDHPY